MNSSLLENFIASDRPTLAGWERADLGNLDESVLYRLAKLAGRGSFDSQFGNEQIVELQSAVGKPSPRFTFSGDNPECAYLVFGDGSLYYANNAQDEVWADSRGFITERVLDKGNRDAADFAPESAEGKLIRNAAFDLLE